MVYQYGWGKSLLGPQVTTVCEAAIFGRFEDIPCLEPNVIVKIEGNRVSQFLLAPTALEQKCMEVGVGPGCLHCQARFISVPPWVNTDHPHNGALGVPFLPARNTLPWLSLA